MRSIGVRLLLVNVLLVAIPIIGVSFARFYEREMLRGLEEDLIHQAELLRLCLADGTPLAARGQLLVEVARRTRARVRLVDAGGQVVADSHARGVPEGAEPEASATFGRRDVSSSVRPAPVVDREVDVSERVEIRRALAGGYGARSRVWHGRGRVFLFSALPIVEKGHVVGAVYLTRSTGTVKLALYHLRRSLFRLFVAAVLATAVVSLFLAATISRPLGQLTRLAGRVAAGDRSVSLDLGRKDEIGALARAFDALAKKLDGRAREVADQAANASHELKAPLTSIRGAAELLLDGAAEDPAARRTFLANILGDCHRLDRLVTRLLELSRLEADAGPVESIDAHALVTEVAARCHGRAPVIVTAGSALPPVAGRPAALASALGNLLDNAQSHAAPASAISVDLFPVQGHLHIAVTNRGPVLPPERQRRIWDRFYTTRSGEGGTGLGLAIVSAVAQTHGGACTVTSSESAGTTFTLILPASRAAGPAGRAEVHRPLAGAAAAPYDD